MEIPTHKQIVADIEKFLKSKGITGSQFGQEYLSDSGALSRLKKGADPRLSKVQRIYKAIKGIS